MKKYKHIKKIGKIVDALTENDGDFSADRVHEENVLVAEACVRLTKLQKDEGRIGEIAAATVAFIDHLFEHSPDMTQIICAIEEGYKAIKKYA